MTKLNAQDCWCHVRPTKAADVRIEFQPLDAPRKRDAVWPIAALVVGLMVALTLTLATALSR